MRQVCLYSLLLLPILLIGQSDAAYRRYDTQKYFYEHHYNDFSSSGSPLSTPYEVLQRKSKIEAQVANRIEYVRVEPIKIEIVFHILSISDEGEAQKLVDDQIKYLNRDFNANNPASSHPNHPLGLYLRHASNPKINFTVAKIDQPHTAGIVTIRQSKSDWSTYDEMKDPNKGGSAPYASLQYINIWVVDLPTGINSYATSPYYVNDLSGIVIDRRFFSTKEKGAHGYTEGKTLTHLMGNYLGLLDLWNEYESCADDYVDDTSIHNMANKGQP